MSGTTGSGDVPEQICYEAVHQTADAVYITDTDGTIEYVNPAFEEITGYDKEEALGETPRILNSSEYDDSFYEELWETINSGEQWETEIVDETKSGDRIILDQTISPITTPDGEVEKFVAVARDVTEKKERKRDLERFKEIQSRILRHNLRNRLNIIKSHAEYCAQNLDKKYARRADDVISATNTLERLSNKTRLIEQLLDLELKPKTIHLDEEIQERVELYRDRFPGVAFSFECPSDCEIEAIPETSVALGNLIENAAKHNDREQPTVDITVRSDEAATVITISGDGPGIPEQELLALEQGVETSLNHGTGIGLWLVGWIIEKADASFTYETGTTGTEFSIRFPQPEQA